MACSIITVDGVTAIICGTRRRPGRCACGQPGPLLCDWKVPGGTCDKPVCPACAQEVAPNKHLCPTHQASYRHWLESRHARPAP